MPLTVSRITAAQHLDYLRARGAGGGLVSMLQTPAWGAVKAEWRHESLGWFDDEALIGAGLVLYRQVPKLPRFLAYLPEGPDIDWLGEGPAARGLSAPERTHSLAEWLIPLQAHLRRVGSFAAKIGPPVWVNRWDADTLKTAIAAGAATALRDLPASHSDPRAQALAGELTAAGWSQKHSTGSGFGDVQPRYVFQIALAGQTEESLLKSFNQLWRRNIKRAAKLGVEVTVGGLEDLPAFHEVYQETAVRDRFTPRGLPYFQRMYKALTAEDPARIKLYLARHAGVVHAATISVQVNRHVWYSYGASTTAGRDLRPSNAIQWRMICDALAAGADTYDMRGITDTLDPADAHFGLLQFKVGTGGYAQEYLGEWDFPIRPGMARVIDAYMRRR